MKQIENYRIIITRVPNWWRGCGDIAGTTAGSSRGAVTAHVRTKTWARAASPAAVVRTAEQFLEYVRPLSHKRKTLHNNTKVAQEDERNWFRQQRYLYRQHRKKKRYPETTEPSHN
jgi:hypothetical protein